MFAEPSDERLGMKSGQHPVAVNSQKIFELTAKKGIPIGPVYKRSREAGECAHQIGVPEHPVGESSPFLLFADEVVSDQRPRKVNVQLMGRSVRTDGVANLALIAKVRDFVDLLPIQLFDLAENAGDVIGHLEQFDKRLTERIANAAAVADIKDPRDFLLDRFRVPEFRGPEIEIHWSSFR